MNPLKVTRTPHLAAGDIKLLHVFIAVAEAESFAGAQSALNVSASTVSTQIAALESRLEMRLCNRGRSGFRLTESGRKVLEAARRVFAAHDEFSSEVWSVRQRQRRVLKIGVVDNVIFNQRLKLVEAFRQISAVENTVEIHLATLPPSEIEQRVLNAELDIGVGVFFHKIPGLRYETFLTVDQVLFCGKDNALFDKRDKEISLDEVTACPYVARPYMGEGNMIPGVLFKLMSYAQNMEAVALLVLSGRYIGHLPEYYARRWVETGQLRPILPDQLGYTNKFGFAVREVKTTNRVLEKFSDLLLSLHKKVLDPST